MNLTAGNVKTAMAAAGAVSRDLWQVPIEQLRVIPDFNVRTENAEYLEHLDTIANLIIANGYRQDKPMAGYVAQEDGRQIIYITDGHTRLRAVQKAVEAGKEIKAVPVVVAPKGTSIEDLTVGLVNSNNGRPLMPYEIGVVCKRLMGFGWTENDIALKLGMTKQRIGDLLGLLGADPEIRSMVAKGEVSASQAIKTMKDQGDKATDALKEGVAKAKSAGKKKATAKHIPTSRPNYKAVVAALLAWSKETQYEVPADLKPVLKLAREATA